MDLPTAPKNKQSPTAGHAENMPKIPAQSTIFDAGDIATPDHIPDPTPDEATETLERAKALRDYLARESELGFFENAVLWAGLPARPRGRPNVVNAGAPRLAIRMGWAVRTGGTHAAELFDQSHSGLVRQYRRPINGGAL